MKLPAPVREFAPLLLVALSLILHHTATVSSLWIFALGLAAIAVLADWVRRGTEQVAEHAGAAIGSLLTVSFGNAAELVLALFMLAQARTEVVQAQITGSIIGTTLLFLGVSVMAGGLRYPKQTFSKERVGLLGTLLLLVAIAILLPAVFDFTERVVAPRADRMRLETQLSVWVSVLLLVLYGAHLIYVLVTHRTARFSEVTASLGLSPVFMGVVVLALVGTIADLFASVSFARADRIEISIGLCVGSALQIALVVAPVLVLVSWAMGRPMSLVLGSPLDLFAIATSTFIVRTIAADGETNWYEGFLLIGVYALFALAYFFEVAG